MLLDGPGMSPFVDENGRAGVPQIVEPETDRESSGLHCRLELPTIEVVVEQPQAGLSFRGVVLFVFGILVFLFLSIYRGGFLLVDPRSA